MPWGILSNPRLVLGLVISLFVLSLPIFPIEVTETSLVLNPYAYEQSLVRVTQAQPFLWIYPVTQAQYIITNNETAEGKFNLNFTFDNGEDTQTQTKTVTFMAREKKAVTVYSHLRGKSTVTLNVIPPMKSAIQRQTVTKNVNAWYYLGFR